MPSKHIRHSYRLPEAGRFFGRFHDEDGSCGFGGRDDGGRFTALYAIGEVAQLSLQCPDDVTMLTGPIMSIGKVNACVIVNRQPGVGAVDVEGPVAADHFHPRVDCVQRGEPPSPVKQSLALAPVPCKKLIKPQHRVPT